MRGPRALAAAAQGALVLALVGAALPASAAAIPWDQEGLGIGPRLAGEVGASQTGRVVPVNGCEQSYANDSPRAGPPIGRDRALVALRGDRRMTVRLNRLFESDGAAEIAEFKRMARHYGSLGFNVLVQVRYHPTPAEDGRIGAWVRYVRRVVRALGPNRHVIGLQITNEVNIAFSPNTSDGAYRRAVEALARGVPAAKREARRRGFDQLTVGFNYVWRYGDADADFWRAVGAAGGRRLRRATDWVGIDAYPGTFVPASVVHPGDALLEAIAQVRECYMPLAGFGRRTPIAVDELGYPTGPGRGAAAQRTALAAFVHSLNRYRGTYRIDNVNWFGLRDNDSRAPDLQSHFGLLRSDYTPKLAFAVYRRLVYRLGARPAP